MEANTRAILRQHPAIIGHKEAQPDHAMVRLPHPAAPDQAEIP